MSKKKPAKKEEADQQSAGEGRPQADQAGPSKMGMVREALGTLGNDAKPKQIDEYVRAKYGVEIPPTMISSYKSTITGGTGRGGAGGGGAAGGTVSLGDIEIVRGLVERMGANELLNLVRVLS